MSFGCTSHDCKFESHHSTNVFRQNIHISHSRPRYSKWVRSRKEFIEILVHCYFTLADGGVVAVIISVYQNRGKNPHYHYEA